MATSDDLSPQARRIVDAARDADQPSDGDRRRVRGAVMAAVAAAAAATAVPLAVKAMAVAAALAAVGVGAYLVGGDREPAAARDHRPALDVDTEDGGRPAAEAPREPRRAPEPEPEPEPEMEFAPDHVKVPEQRPPSTIQAERELLARARAAHTDGRAGDALALLDDYTRQFAGGKLLEERSALRVLVLCDLGRTPQAMREAGSFLRRWPHSVQAERVHRSCAGDANE